MRGMESVDTPFQIQSVFHLLFQAITFDLVLSLVLRAKSKQVRIITVRDVQKCTVRPYV